MRGSVWAIVLGIMILGNLNIDAGLYAQERTLSSAPLEKSPDGTRWVCPPCGLPCDTMVFASPGVCPKCGMSLVKQTAAQAELQNTRKVAILIFNGVEIIDYTGPWEVFGAAGFDVYTVSETKDPVTTAMGMTVIPKYTFADAPVPEVLLVPGGGVHGALQSAATVKWVADVSARARQTMSVCNGAFILARAGLLDGLTATTTCHLIDDLRTQYPRIRVVNDQRYVDNGRVITTAGLSAGIDGAFHVVSKLLGNGEAQRTALGLEYNWEPAGTFVRAALADQYLPEFTGFDAKMLSTRGDRTHWEMSALISTPRSVEEITRLTTDELVSRARHTKSAVKVRRLTPEGATDQARIEWTFTDDLGHAWQGGGTVGRSADHEGKFVATLRLSQVDK